MSVNGRPAVDNQPVAGRTDLVHEQPTLPADAPPALVAELQARDANVVELERGRFQHPRRTYFACSGAGGRLHGHYSTNPADVPLFAYELEVRTLVGTRGPLRAPPALASGPGWLLAQTVESESLPPPAAVERVVEAAMRIRDLQLPSSPWPNRPGGIVALAGRRARLLRSPLPMRDLAAARRVLADSSLPEVTSHGSFQRLHVFLSGGAAWVIDWEQAGRKPLGYDLMTYWSNLEDDETRALVLEASLAAVGPNHGRDLLRLRYSLLVRMIAAKFADDAQPEGGRRLLELLPAVRDAAFG
jgi:hypothetical protein